MSNFHISLVSFSLPKLVSALSLFVIYFVLRHPVTKTQIRSSTEGLTGKQFINKWEKVSLVFMSLKLPIFSKFSKF